MQSAIEHQTVGPCAAGMALEAQRAEEAVPSLFDEPPADDGHREHHAAR